MLVNACKEARSSNTQTEWEISNERKWKERKTEWMCWPTLCSSLLSLKPPVWASDGVSGLLSDSTYTVSCDTTSLTTPSATPENSVKIDSKRKNRERKHEVYLPDKARTHRHTHKAKRLPVYPPPPSPELSQNRARIYTVQHQWFMSSELPEPSFCSSNSSESFWDQLFSEKFWERLYLHARLVYYTCGDSP